MVAVLRRVGLAALYLGLVLVGCVSAEAQTAPRLLSPDGLSGGRYVGSALAPPKAIRLASALGYGFTGDVLHQNDRHHRVALELGGAWVVAPWLQLALGAEGRLDHHTPNGAGAETGLLASSHIATRHAFMLGERSAVALSPRLLFPGAKDVQRGARAVSIELAALFSQRLPRDAELSFSLGYRIDRSRYAVKDAAHLVPAERLAAALSSHDAYLVGVLGTLPIAPLQLGLEWSWDITAGGSPGPLHSPMRVRAVAQRAWGERLTPGLEVGVDTSARPELIGLVRIEPRVWARVSLAVQLDKPVKTSVRVPRYVAPQPEPAPAIAPAHRGSLQVTDTEGVPLVGAQVRVGGREYRSDDRGEVVFELPASGMTEVVVSAEGFDPATLQVSADAAQRSRLALAPRPGSEIKGVVRNLASEPLVARIEVLPIGMVVSTDREGQFNIRVAPGDYTLRISAAGYEPQERSASVEPSGVTIIVVDLKRARK